MSKSVGLSKSLRITPKEPVVAPKPNIKVWLRSNFLVGLILIGCMLGATLIALLSLNGKSLRLDEAQSLWQTSHSLRGILKVVASDVHVPLYHMMLHFWQLYFGQSIGTARLMSLLFFLLSIPAVYLLARQLLSRNWALFTVVMFSFSPIMNWYASTARMYTLLVLLATLSQYFYLRILKGRSGWLGYSLTALAGVYTHYFFIFNLLTQGLFYLFNRRAFPKGSFTKFIILAGLIIAELTPWLLYFKSFGAGSTTRPLLVRPTTVDYFNAYSQFVFGFQTSYVNTILVSCWPLLMLVALFAVKRNQRVSTEVGYIATMAFIPVTVAFVLSFIVTPFFLSRYLISAVAPLIILAIWLVSNYSRKVGIILASLAVVTLVFTSVQQNSSINTPVYEDYQGVAKYIMDHSQANDVVVLSAPFTVYPFEYYYNGTAQIETLPPWNRQSNGGIPPFDKNKLASQAAALEKNHHYIYLVLSQDQGYEEDIHQYFLTHYKQISKQHYSPDLDLYVYQVGYYQVPAL